MDINDFAGVYSNRNNNENANDNNIFNILNNLCCGFQDVKREVVYSS